MFLTDSRLMRGLGILPLQDHRPRSRVPSSERASAVAARVIGRRDGAGQDGRYVAARGTTGDLVGASLWAVRDQQREAPGWSFAWSTVTLKADGGAPVTQAPARGRASVQESGPSPVLPALGPTHARYADVRFSPMTARMPSEWPDFPDGWSGIVLASNRDDAQEDHWHPTDPRIMAVHRDAGGMSSVVSDSQNGVPGIAARVSSLAYVLNAPPYVESAAGQVTIDPFRGSSSAIQPGRGGLVVGVSGGVLGGVGRIAATAPDTGSHFDNALAWMIGHSNGFRGGYVLDNDPRDHTRRDASDPRRPITESGRAILGTTAGFTVPSSPGQQVLLGGPLLFPVAPLGGKTLPALGVTVGGREREPHVVGMVSCNYGGPFDLGHADDVHRLGKDADGHPVNPVHISTDALYRMHGRADGPLDFVTEYQRGLRYETPVPVTLGFDGNMGRWRWWTTTPYYIVEEVGRRPIPPEAGPDPRRPITPGGKPPRTDGFGGTGREYVAFPMETSFAATLGRPQKITPGSIDLRQVVGRVDEADREDVQRALADANLAPVTIRVEAYGNASGTDWNRTGGKGVIYPGGYGPGGIAFLVPVDRMGDLEPAHLVRPTSYVTLGVDVRLGLGKPHTDGTVANGWSVRRDSSDRLVFAYHDSAGSATDRVTLLTDGGVLASGLKSGLDQTDAGAATGELYVDTNDDNTVKRGV